MIPGWGTKTPHATQFGQKEKKETGPGSMINAERGLCRSDGPKAGMLYISWERERQRIHRGGGFELDLEK